MAKDKRLKRLGREKKQRARERKKRELDPRFPPLREAWLSLMPPATQGRISFFPRLYWRGVPDRSDPLLLVGMAAELAWGRATDDRGSEMVVSSIQFEEFVAEYPDQTLRGVVYYDYFAVLIQLVDASSAYGQLLARQRIRRCGKEVEKTLPPRIQV